MGGAREYFRLGPEGKQGGTGRTKETRAGRASRENVEAGEVTERCGEHLIQMELRKCIKEYREIKLER